ncbi:unnamed protein product, partial [Heligmosomoides polygyrus]|uniref:Transmembrane protein 188 n=1 Tax=Heligmosomoides polygyrus TaxID=6339 RepID=A0A183FPM6_HELPZ
VDPPLPHLSACPHQHHYASHDLHVLPSSHLHSGTYDTNDTPSELWNILDRMRQPRVWYGVRATAGTCSDAALHIFRKSYKLQSTYQLRENATVLRLVLPLAIFQTFTYGGFALSGLIISHFRTSMSEVNYRTAFAVSYVIPLYTIGSPVLLRYIIRRSRQMNEDKLKAESYFRVYSKMWDDRKDRK